MTLIEHYEQAVRQGEIQDDVSQRTILASLDRVSMALQHDNKSWLGQIWSSKTQGVYIYGPVGVGKTYLVDLFFRYVAEEHKARFHFHHFMQQIDAELRHLQGCRDPLQVVAKKIAKTTRLLCFDEFLVHDIAYASILAELLHALIKNRIILVITANTSPEGLYAEGVHRERFLPAIELIKSNCEILELNTIKDYRLGHSFGQETYFYLIDSNTEERLTNAFFTQQGKVIGEGNILIQHRNIPFIKQEQGTIWFDFKIICGVPRSQLDYLEIAENFETVIISNIPRLTSNDTLSTLLFIYLIDVMYDRGVKFILAAAVPLEGLYVEGEVIGEFQRARSRLEEMRSIKYLARHPRRHVHQLIQSP